MLLPVARQICLFLPHSEDKEVRFLLFKTSLWVHHGVMRKRLYFLAVAYEDQYSAFLHELMGQNCKNDCALTLGNRDIRFGFQEGVLLNWGIFLCIFILFSHKQIHVGG